MTRPFVLAFRGYFISSPEPLQALTGVLITNLLILTGIYLKLKSIEKALKAYLVLIFFTFLSMTPLFFPDQQQIDMRYVTVGTWLISYMVVTSIFLILTTITFYGRGFKAKYVTFILFLIFSITINYRYFNVIQPIHTETKTFISSAVNNCKKSQISSGIYVLPRTGEWPSNNYIGMFSQVTDLASSWVPIEAVKIQIYEDQSLNGLDIPVIWGEKINSGCIVDLNTYPNSRN
jgi:hypothetical protein